MTKTSLSTLAALSVACVFWTEVGAATTPVAGKTRLISTSASGVAANGSSALLGFSPDGTRLAFLSTATNLVPVKSSHAQVYVKDLRSGKVILVSSSSSGAPGNADAGTALWSPDGTRILFDSEATNLGTHGLSSAYIKDLRSGKTTVLAPSLQGGLLGASSWSPNGRRIAFEANRLLNGALIPELISFDTVSGKLSVLSQTSQGVFGGGRGFQCYLECYAVWSPDSSRIAFSGEMPNLVLAAGATPYQFPNSTSPPSELYVEDVSTGELTLASSTSTGAAANNDCCDYDPPLWSPNGKQIMFESWASNLGSGGGGPQSMSVYVKDTVTHQVTRISPSNAEGPSYYAAAWSPDGTQVVYETEPVQGSDSPPYLPYLKNLKTGVTVPLSPPADGLSGKIETGLVAWNPVGSSVLLESSGQGGSRLFVVDLATRAATLVVSSTASQLAAEWNPRGHEIAWYSEKGGVHLTSVG